MSWSHFTCCGTHLWWDGWAFHLLKGRFQALLGSSKDSFSSQWQQSQSRLQEPPCTCPEGGKSQNKHKSTMFYLALRLDFLAPQGKPKGPSWLLKMFCFLVGKSVTLLNSFLGGKVSYPSRSNRGKAKVSCPEERSLSTVETLVCLWWCFPSPATAIMSTPDCLAQVNFQLKWSVPGRSQAWCK